MRLWPRATRRGADTPLSAPSPARGLFIIGAARSGTTVLQNAFNESPDVFILGEPNLHLEVGEPGFAARYNAMHRSWGNQETKSTYCPPLLPFDGTSEDYLGRLSQTYKWVGSKIVVNTRREADWLDRLKAYHCDRFYTANYVFTFRNPLAVVQSTRGLQILSETDTDSTAAILANYLETVVLFIWALRNLKHVRAVVHEDVNEQEMASLGSWLNVDFSRSHDYYDDARVRSHRADDLSASEQNAVQGPLQIYNDLRDGLQTGFEAIQLEQNDNNFSAGHYTPLGSLERRARTIRDKLLSEQF